MKISAAGALGMGLALYVLAAGADDHSPVSSLHAQVITPASDALFQAESQPPATSAEWTRIAAKAADIGRVANKLGMLESAKDRPEWRQFAHLLGEAAEKAARAAEAEDQEALVNANGEIVSVCEDCHAKYRDAGRSMKE